MGRPPCCDKSNVKRGLWTAEEDAKLLAHVSKLGIGNWTLVPKKAGLNRCGKSCRLRWTNYLRPDLKHDTFTPQEEDLIINLHQAIGSRWSLIAKQLPGRTDNDVKNYWNTKLRKKLYTMGIDPVTHKPISQILSEFGNISGLPNNHHIPSTNMISNTTTTTTPARIFYNNNNNNIGTSHQFQVMTNQSLFNNNNNSNVQPHFFNEVTSPCSSSSSSHVTDLSSPQVVLFAPPALPPPLPLPPCNSNNWSEFFLGDNTEDQAKENDLEGFLLSSSSSSHTNSSKLSNGNGSDQNGSNIQEGQFAQMINNDHHHHHLQPENSSFVDAILDRDSELRAAFPEFLDGSFEY
ncbi:hypothetical protein CsatA_017611 [Cannabis sativa]